MKKKLQLLYVEDNPRDYESYSRMLVSRGWGVERACNPPEALERLRKAPPRHDAILIDRKLNEGEGRPGTWENDWGNPECAGDLLLDRVVAESPYLCPIMLTVIDEADGARDLTKHGAQDYIVKGGRKDEKQRFGDILNERCRQAVVRHQLKQMRHSLLSLPTFDSLLIKVFHFVRDAFAKEGRQLDLFYLSVLPGWGLQVHADEGNPHPLALNWLANMTATTPLPLIAESGNVSKVLHGARRVLTTQARDLVGQTLVTVAAVQLLVPVHVVPSPNSEKPRIAGAFALECNEAFLLDRDVELFENLVALLADYLATRHWQRISVDCERKEQQENLLHNIHWSLCGPLQQVQSSLEVLDIQLQRGAMPTLEELRERVTEIKESGERASVGLENIRLVTPPPELRPYEYDLTRLTRQTLRRCQENLQAAGVEVDDSGLEARSVNCELDPQHFSYALEGLLRNCWETALREPARRPDGGEARWRITLRLELDPKQSHTARLSLFDNGPGFSDDVLARFAEGRFIPSQKRTQGKPRNGLGLFEARRMLEMLGGQLEIRNAPEGGALVQLALPLHASAPLVVPPPGE